MIDLSQINPNWELAQAHASSTRPGKPSSYQTLERCPCCFRVVDKDQIGVGEHAKELQTLGLAYPLFFTFLKYAIILVCFQVCSYNILELITGTTYDVQYCQSHLEESGQPICSFFFVEIASLNPVVSLEEEAIRTCSFAIILIMLVFIRNRIHKTLLYYRERQIKISNYSLLIKGLPLLLQPQAKIHALFQQFFSQPIPIEECIPIGSLEVFYRLKTEKEDLRKRAQAVEKENKEEESRRVELVSLARQIEQNRVEFEKQTENIIHLYKEDRLPCEKAIVILPTESLKQQAIEDFYAYQSKPQKMKLLANLLGIQSSELPAIKIVQAPEPEQIIWANINIRRSTQIARQVLGWVFTLLFLGVITGGFYLIIREKSHLVEKWSELIEQHKGSEEGAQQITSLHLSITAIVYFFILLVVLLNKFAVSKFLHFVSAFERYSTYAKEEYYFAVKYTITLFLTTAVMTLLVEGLTFHNFNAYEYGVVEEESIMFVLNAFFIPLLWLLNPLQLIRVVRRRLSYGRKDLTQGEANSLMMDEPASLGKHFAETIEILWFTFMYSSLIPVGALFILAGLFINYWVVKFTILRRSSLEQHISGNFLTLALKLLDVCLVMQPAGQLIFDSLVKDGPHVSSIVCLVLGVLYCLLPVDWLLSKLHHENFRLHERTYREARVSLVGNYHMLHPIYSLKKIFVEREVERLNFYWPKEQIRSQVVLPARVEHALRRDSWSPKKKTEDRVLDGGDEPEEQFGQW